ncbi:Dystrophin, partial [Frankliniella fusca]
MEGVYIDEREDVQKKTFAKWINSQLAKRNLQPISDLFQDLQDGNHLLTLLEILTGKEYKREKGKMRVHHLNNVNKALQILEQNNVKLVNISSNDIVDGSTKLTLGLVWSIILHWQVHYHLKDLMSELQQTNLEKTLLAWCRQNTQNYPGVDIKNFSTSWSDGLAFNALVHRFHSELFQFPTVVKMHPNARLEHAFRLAQELHGIERLLDPEDVNTSQPDKKSIMMYVMCLFQSLPHSEMDANCLDFSIHSDNSSISSPVVETRSLDAFSAGMLGVPTSRPLSMATNVSVELSGYQRALEDVLTWLLEAEDRLTNASKVEGPLHEIKEQFHTHEQFLLELARHQSDVRSVLEEGTHIIHEGGLSRDEEDEVRIQMKLLNTRWEELRVKAMERQTKIHEVLMHKQQEELDSFRQWLTVTEDRISRMAKIGPTYADLVRQVEQHPLLCADLEKQEASVASLSEMVIVVDDNNPDSEGESHMEDQLTALNERWAHIQKWTQERWLRLKELNNSWADISGRCVLLQVWLDSKEKLLKGMEADPALEIGQVLERIKTLQTTRREMDGQQSALEYLQEETSQLDSKLSPGWTSEIQEKIETIQDKWEALSQIIEVQAQRICDSGFDFNLYGGTAEDRDRDKDSSAASEPKRRRTGTVKRVKFESALDQLVTFMERTENLLEQVASSIQNVSPELRQKLDDTSEEISIRQSDLQKLIRLGQELTIEMQADGADDMSVYNEQQKWMDAEQRLIQLSSKVQSACQAVQYHQDMATVVSELSAISGLLDGHRKWLEKIETSPKASSPSVLADQIRVKLKSMRSQDDRLARLKVVAQRISENDQTDRQLAADVIHLGEQWMLLQQRYVDHQTKLSGGGNIVVEKEDSADFAKQMKEPPPAIKVLMEWVNSTESSLLSDHVVLAELPVMELQLKRFQLLEEQLKHNEEEIEKLCSEVDAQDLLELSTHCSDIKAILHERQTKLKPYIETMLQFSEEVAGLTAWLQDVETFLKAEQQLPVGDLETLEAQLEQSNALQDDIETLERNVQNITVTLTKLKEHASESFGANLMSQHKALMDKWEKAVEGAKKHNSGLKAAHQKSQAVNKGIEDFSRWLTDLEKEVPKFGTASSSAELFQLKGKYQSLKQKVDDRTEAFRQLNEIGNDLMLSGEGPSVQELARRITQLNAKWSEVIDVIFEKHRVLQDASHQYGEFKALVAQEMDWLDKLEKRLRKSPKSAADAEEISEELDDLENYIRNHPDARLTRIQEIGEALENGGVMSEMVKAEVAAATNRWNLLSQQARDRTVLLEVSAAEAQESEGQILELQEWLTHVDALLTARLQNDIFADDLPDDQRLVDEFEIQSNTLKEMSAQVSAYENAGKLEAASRLKEQMQLLEKRFNEVQERFKLFQSSSSDLEPHLMRVLRELRGVEEATCLLDIASDDPEGIEGQLKHCTRFYCTLSDLKGEVEMILKKGREMVDESKATDPSMLNSKLDALKDLYNKLGLQIADSKAALENAQELSQSMHKDIPALNEWMDMVESELDEREALPMARRDMESERAFLKELLEEEVPQWETMRDRVKSAFKSFTDICDPVYLDVLRDRVREVTQRWDRVINRVQSTRTTVEGLEQSQVPDGTSPSVQYPPMGIGNPAFEDLDALGIKEETVNEEVQHNSTPLSVRKENGRDEDTFCLAKDSSLFSQVLNNSLTSSGARELCYHEPKEQKVQMVEVKALEILKSVVTAVEPMEVYPSSSCHQAPQTVEMVEIVEDTEESAPDTDSESPAIARKISPIPVHVKSFSEILLRGKGSKPAHSPRRDEFVKPIPVVEVKAEDTPPLCLEMTDRVKRMEETTVTAWRKKELNENVAHVSDQIEKDEPRVTLRKEVEVSKTYQLIGNFSKDPSSPKPKTPEEDNFESSLPGPSFQEGVRRGKRTGTRPEKGLMEQDSLEPRKRPKTESYKDVEEWDRDSFYGSDKETDDIVEFSDNDSMAAAVTSHTIIDTSEDDSSSSDDEDPAFYSRYATGKARLSDQGKVADANDSNMSGDFEKYVDEALRTPRVSAAVDSKSLDNDVIDFEIEAQQMLERMDRMLHIVRNINEKPDPTQRIEVLEKEIVGLASDAATLISRGDGLVLLVHTSDPERADLLKKTSQDRLRSKWSQVMSETEIQKTEAQRAEVTLREMNKLMRDVDLWLSSVKKKLQHANNDEEQLQALKAEVSQKEQMMRQLSELAAELDIQQANQTATEKLKPLTSRWDELLEELRRFQKNHKQDKEVNITNANISSEFVVKVNKIRETTSSVSRQLNAHPLGGRDYEAFPTQEEALKAVRGKLASIKPQVEKVESERDVVVRTACAPEVSGQVRRVVDKLREEWAQVNRAYAERHSRWLSAQEVWVNIQNESRLFSEWLETAESVISEWKNSDLPIEVAKAKQKDLEKQVTVKHRMMNALSSTCRDVTGRPGPEQDPQSRELAARVDELRRRWQAVLAELTAQRDRITARASASSTPTKDAARAAQEAAQAKAQACLDRVAYLLTSAPNPSDDTSLSVRLSMVKARDSELQKHRRDMDSLKRAAGAGAGAGAGSAGSLEEAMAKASAGLGEHRELLDSKLAGLRRFTSQLDAVIAWVMEVRTRISISRDLAEPDRARVIESIMQTSVRDRDVEVTDVLENYNNLEKECEAARQPVSVELQEKVRKLRDDWSYVKNRGEPAAAPSLEARRVEASAAGP